MFKRQKEIGDTGGESNWWCYDSPGDGAFNLKNKQKGVAHTLDLLHNVRV